VGTGRHGARANELKGIGTHIGYTQFLNNIERVLDNAETLGLPHVGTANSRGVIHGETTEGYKRAAEDFNAFAAAGARGLRFYQHNHSGEFAIDQTTGIRLYDMILAETDPALVSSSWTCSGHTSVNPASRASTRSSSSSTSRAGSRSTT
jgi:sugar phosphate isomerase/epimerase